MQATCPRCGGTADVSLIENGFNYATDGTAIIQCLLLESALRRTAARLTTRTAITWQGLRKRLRIGCAVGADNPCSNLSRRTAINSELVLMHHSVALSKAKALQIIRIRLHLSFSLRRVPAFCRC
jgi:hypothetical protein